MHEVFENLLDRRSIWPVWEASCYVASCTLAASSAGFSGG